MGSGRNFPRYFTKIKTQNSQPLKINSFNLDNAISFNGKHVRNHLVFGFFGDFEHLDTTGTRYDEIKLDKRNGNRDQEDGNLCS